MRFGGYLGAPKQQALASRQAPDFFGASKALGSLRNVADVDLPENAVEGLSFIGKVRAFRKTSETQVLGEALSDLG